MKRACLMCVPLALCCAAAGCVPIFYAYPSVSYVPALNLGPGHDNIFAFRVDVADDESSLDLAKPGHYRFRQVRIAPHGSIMGQGKLALDSGFYWNLIAVTYAQRTNHTIRVRLYRAGFDLLEIQPWQSEAGLEWTEVRALAAQEKIVDKLLRPTGAGAWTQAHKDDNWGFSQIEPGSVSPEHRPVLLFAASEYERLASDMALEADELAEACTRCHAKAKFLRELADK
jgi:hypothetical protein